MQTRKELLKTFCRDFYKTGLAVEVGVKTGDFSRAILQNWAGTLYMVDAWRFYRGYQDIANVTDEYHAAFMGQAMLNVANYREKAVMIRDESVRAASMFADRSLDWVYIDAAHDTENCYADIQAWLPKVRDGGVIWGDDYMDGIYHDSVFGVKTAVQKAFNFFETNEGQSEDNPQWWKVIK
jgi:predicted O-methyltransferase YrrM